MCGTCGCGNGYRLDGELRQEHAGHEHAGHDGHGHAGGGQTVLLQEKVLAKNDALAERNRAWLRQRGVLAVNLMSSPGSGKTTLLERTARDLAGAA
ncbi:MAG: hydrogenase accessory protein HypB, partial [Actinobacteria bacterium]|nr:hydrogenase accessory protein HypB [Actinomycetota bacterium]